MPKTPKSPENARPRAKGVLRVQFCKAVDHNTALHGVSNRGRLGGDSAAVQKNAASRPRKHSAIGGGWRNDLQPGAEMPGCKGEKIVAYCSAQCKYCGS